MSASSSVLAHIARPYASALFELAEESKSVDEIEQSLDALDALIDESEEFSKFLRSPVISSDEKREAMDAIVHKIELPQAVSNFLQLVARNGRLFALAAMISEFKALAADARGELRAEVTSAAPLSKAQLETLSQTLKDKIGKTVALDTHVDSSLIGGLVVKLGSRMIDTSLKTKLSAMKIAMKEVG